MVDDHALLDALRFFATRSVEDYEVAVVLDELGHLARDVIGLDGAGITLKVLHGHAETKYISATDDATLQTERAQDRCGEGACIDSIHARHPVTAEDLEQDDRWPRYRPVVLDAGFRRVAGIPMLGGGRVVGALNAYRSEPGAWTDPELAAGTLFAQVATSFIANASAYDDQAVLAARLQGALDSRVIIEQAKGVLVGRHRIRSHAAFETMRQHARAHRINLHDVAADVVSGRQTFPLTTPDLTSGWGQTLTGGEDRRLAPRTSYAIGTGSARLIRVGYGDQRSHDGQFPRRGVVRPEGAGLRGPSTTRPADRGDRRPGSP